MKKKIPPFGIRYVYGPLGAGKSRYLAAEIVNLVCTTDRLIFTNVSVKLDEIEKEAKRRTGKDGLSKKVRPITRQHFLNYCMRMAKIQEVKEQLLLEYEGDTEGEAAEFHENQAFKAARDKVTEQDGPETHLRTGEKQPDWFPASSVLIIDELKKWYPAEDLRNEPKEVGAMLAMSRHSLLLIWIASQDTMQVSKNWRRLVTEYVTCGELSRQFWFFPFKWFGVWSYDKSQVDENGKVRPSSMPLWKEFYIPAIMGWKCFNWYDSHTHAGSIEDLEAEGKIAVASTIGKVGDEVFVAQPKKKRGCFVALLLLPFFPLRLLWRIVRGLGFTVWQSVKFIAIMIAVVAVYSGGYQAAINDIQRAEAAKAEAAPVASKNEPRPVITSITKNGATINGKRVRIGEKIDGWLLFGLDWKKGDALLINYPRIVAIRMARPGVAAQYRVRYIESPKGAAENSTAAAAIPNAAKNKNSKP